MFFLYLILRLAFKVDTPTMQEPAQSTANNNIMLLSPVFGDVLVVSAGFTCGFELFPVWLLPLPVLLLLLLETWQEEHSRSSVIVLLHICQI